MPPRCTDQVTAENCQAVTPNAVLHTRAATRRCDSALCNITRGTDGTVSPDYTHCCQDPPPTTPTYSATTTPTRTQSTTATTSGQTTQTTTPTNTQTSTATSTPTTTTPTTTATTTRQTTTCGDQVTTAACQTVTPKAVFNTRAANRRCGSWDLSLPVCNIARGADGTVGPDYALCCQDPDTCQSSPNGLTVRVTQATCAAALPGASLNAANRDKPCTESPCAVIGAVRGEQPTGADFNLCCKPPPTCKDKVTDAVCNAVTLNAVFNTLAANKQCGTANCDVSAMSVGGGSAIFSADYLLCCKDPTTTSSTTSTSVPYCYIYC